MTDASKPHFDSIESVNAFIEELHRTRRQAEELTAALDVACASVAATIAASGIGTGATQFAPLTPHLWAAMPPPPTMPVGGGLRSGMPTAPTSAVAAASTVTADAAITNGLPHYVSHTAVSRGQQVRAAAGTLGELRDGSPTLRLPTGPVPDALGARLGAATSWGIACADPSQPPAAGGSNCSAPPPPAPPVPTSMAFGNTGALPHEGLMLMALAQEERAAAEELPTVEPAPQAAQLPTCQPSVHSHGEDVAPWLCNLHSHPPTADRLAVADLHQEALVAVTFARESSSISTTTLATPILTPGTGSKEGAVGPEGSVNYTQSFWSTTGRFAEDAACKPLRPEISEVDPPARERPADSEADPPADADASQCAKRAKTSEGSLLPTGSA